MALSIGIVSSSLSRSAGGVLPIMQGNAHELLRRGVEVAVYGVEDAAFALDRGSWSPVEVHACPPGIGRLAYSRALYPAMAQGRHDLVHQHGLWLYPSVAVSKWRRRHGRPVVISTQGMLEPWALQQSAFRKTLASRLFEEANLAAAACLHCSDSEIEGLRRFGLTNPIAVIPNGVALPGDDRLSPPDWLPSDGRKTLLFLGRLHAKKGVGETLQAWAKAVARSPQIAAKWRLVIAGWGEQASQSEYRAIADDLGLADVLLPGAVFGAEKEALYAHADAFILASYSEGLPMAVLEAWSHRLPVFMTSGCNLPIGFSAGAALEITTSPDEIAAALIAHLERTDLAEIGARGRRLVETHFSWGEAGRQLLSVYLWVLGQGPRPDCVTFT